MPQIMIAAEAWEEEDNVPLSALDVEEIQTADLD